MTIEKQLIDLLKTKFPNKIINRVDEEEKENFSTSDSQQKFDLLLEVKVIPFTTIPNQAIVKILSNHPSVYPTFKTFSLVEPCINDQLTPVAIFLGKCIKYNECDFNSIDVSIVKTNHDWSWNCRFYKSYLPPLLTPSSIKKKKEGIWSIL